MGVGGKKADRRSRYTCEAMKRALLDALEKKPFGKITVKEICERAEINRGTFYLHYFDIDDLLDALIDDVLADITEVLDHLLCPERARCGYPFCEKAQTDERFRPLLEDATTAARLLERVTERGKEGFVTQLMQNSRLTYEQAEAVYLFQINGCMTINRLMLKNKCANWAGIQMTVDRYIKAGLEAFWTQNR